MTTLREAAQQALKSLEGWMDDAPSQWTTRDEKTITDLRAALEQQEPDLRNANPIGLTPPQKALQQKQFRAALEQSEQPTRAQQMRGAGYTRRPSLREMAEEPTVRIKCTVVDDQHPNGVAFEQWGNATGRHCTHPPRREWQGLKEEEIIEAVRESDLDWHRGWTLEDGEPNRYTKLARAIEAALKEKNHE